MKMIIGAACMVVTLTTSAEAHWFARLDSGQKLVVTGIATDDNGIATPLSLTCSDGRLIAEILTQRSAEQDDLPLYQGAKVILVYKVKGGERRKMGLDGTPIAMPGGALGISSLMSVEQSKAIYTSIGQGNRLDFEIVHPEIPADGGVYKIYSAGFTQALLAMHEHCSGLGG